MSGTQIRFEDGAAYEKMMGTWSRLVGRQFLDWLAPAPGLSWIDVGCGNGAFTELLVERCAPTGVTGIDPSEAQLAFARTRPGTGLTRFLLGDAMALPFADHSFDAAVMALVIFFVPDPAKGVAEMVRVVRPGGTVSAYAWDILGHGFPMEPVQQELRALGRKTLHPPRAEVSRMDALTALWTGAGLADVETKSFEVARSFASFDEFWATTTLGPSLTPTLATLSQSELTTLKQRVRQNLKLGADGGITYSSRANAVRGRAPS